jgi:hypothetical protein
MFLAIIPQNAGYNGSMSLNIAENIKGVWGKISPTFGGEQRLAIKIG